MIVWVAFSSSQWQYQDYNVIGQVSQDSVFVEALAE